MNPSIAEEARAALRRHVLEPLMGRCIDREYGGFLVDFDERWRPFGPQHKTLEHATRTTIVFALMDRAFPGAGCDRLVRHGCAFLQQVMWDATHGGFFALVDRAGRPSWDGLKHPHAAAYAANAFVLAEPFLAPGEARSWAKRALAWLDDVAWDPIHGGYWGSFRRDNERYPDGARLPTSDGRDPLGLPPGVKELNTLGDAIEMLTDFVAAGYGQQPTERLAWLVDLVVNRLSDPSGVMPYLFYRDWRLVPDLVRVGQSFQLIHRLLAASDVLHPDGAAGVLARVASFADFALASARHPSGGFCFAVSGVGRTWPSLGGSADGRLWWVQFEAAHAFHILAHDDRVDPDSRARYAQALDQQWAFLRHYYFDQQFGGIWELPVEPRTRGQLSFGGWRRSKSPSLPKTHGWKDPIHEVTTFLSLAGQNRQVERSI